jgi:hypothetical protein
VLAERPDDTAVIGALARLYEAAGDPRQACAVGQSLQLAPDDPDALVAAANAAAGMRDGHRRGLPAAACPALAPQSPDVLAGAGRVYRTAGKKRKAESYFQAALAAQGRAAGRIDNADSQHRLGLWRQWPGLQSVQRHDRPRHARQCPRWHGHACVDARRCRVCAARRCRLRPRRWPRPPMPLPLPAGMQTTALPALPPPASAAIPAGISRHGLADAGRRRSGASRRPCRVPARRRYPRVRPASSANFAHCRRRTATVWPWPPTTADATASGLGRMSDLETVFEGRFGVGEGMLTATVTPTLVDAGDIDTAKYAQSSR